LLLKNQKRLFKDAARGKALYTLSHEAKFQQDVKTRNTHSVKTDELGRNMYAHMYEGLKNKNYNPKPKQVQG